MPMDEGRVTMSGNRVVGILSETTSIWERRAPLTPSHCARLLHNGKDKTKVDRIIVQPSTKRIYHDAQYEDVGCEISDDLSECGLILGVKQPKLDVILPDRTYAFFSHTHKAQNENLPLLDKILSERGTLFDYELIVDDNGKRLLAFGKFAGRAGMVDFLHGLGMRYLNLGYSTPFLSLGASHMYSSLAAAKAAVISVGEEIASLGLPSGICPIVFVFTGSGNVSHGAQEIFKLLPHTFVDHCKLPEIVGMTCDMAHRTTSKRTFQVFGCVVTCEDMVAPKDSTKYFDRDDYYAYPDHYIPIFHEKVAPYASVIVNCMYWEKRFPRLLTTMQLQELRRKQSPLIGICDITCDIGGSLEFVNQVTTIEQPFFRYNPLTGSYHTDMEGDGIICQAVDILPTEFSKEASQHFGDILSKFIGSLASTRSFDELPPHLRKACIAHEGTLTPLYEYIPRMRTSLIDSTEDALKSGQKKYHTLVSLSGHLFDQFLINEALDVIEAAGGSFRLVKCEVGQNSNSMSYSELEVGADDMSTLDQIIDSLSIIATSSTVQKLPDILKNRPTLKVAEVANSIRGPRNNMSEKPAVLILGAGRVCRPAAEFLSSTGLMSSENGYHGSDYDIDLDDIQVIVASLYLKDAEETVEGIPNATAVQLDVSDCESLSTFISQVDVVLSLLPPSFHVKVANICIEHKRHLVTASYVDEAMSRLEERAKSAGVALLCEMGLDPGIDHMLAMKMIHEAHARNGKIKSFTSYCGGLPSPSAANNPLAYKFSWNPSGAIRAGRNSATYMSLGKIVSVDGNSLYDSAVRFRIPDLPAFALECLPNRNSLIYGDLYGIGKESSTIFRATLRYEGFSKIMGTLAKVGFFNTENHPMLKEDHQSTFGDFLNDLLKNDSRNLDGSRSVMNTLNEEGMVNRLILLGYCTEEAAAKNCVRTIKFLGLHEEEKIPQSCKSAFDVVCLRMEKRLSYSGKEKDMVLLHHEVEIEFPDGRPSEKHRMTLLEYGRTENGKGTTAMALTVGIPAAIGALLLLENKIKARGVIRPLEPEVYVPALEMLEKYGIKLSEKVERS